MSFKFKFNEQKSLLNIRANQIKKTGTLRWTSHWLNKEQVERLIKQLQKHKEELV